MFASLALSPECVALLAERGWSPDGVTHPAPFRRTLQRAGYRVHAPASHLLDRFAGLSAQDLDEPRRALNLGRARSMLWRRHLPEVPAANTVAEALGSQASAACFVGSTASTLLFAESTGRFLSVDRQWDTVGRFASLDTLIRFALAPDGLGDSADILWFEPSPTNARQELALQNLVDRYAWWGAILRARQRTP